MKKYILILMIGISLNAFASQDEIYRNQALNFSINDDEKKLKACSDKGNYYCTQLLGAKYYYNEDYASAYPLLLKGVQNDENGLINFLLGNMFSDGRGVLQSDDKALKYYERAAQKGIALGAYNISARFHNKAYDLQRSYYEDEQYKYNLIRAYAWHKISKAMGQTETILKNGDKQPMLESTDEYRRALIQRGWLIEADKLSIEFCSTIPTCVQ